MPPLEALGAQASLPADLRKNLPAIQLDRYETAGRDACAPRVRKVGMPPLFCSQYCFLEFYGVSEALAPPRFSPASIFAKSRKKIERGRTSS